MSPLRLLHVPHVVRLVVDTDADVVDTVYAVDVVDKVVGGHVAVHVVIRVDEMVRRWLVTSIDSDHSVVGRRHVDWEGLRP